MPWLGYACGTCDYCVSGWETLCLEQKNMGYSIDGGFGEYATAYARYVVRVPAEIDPFDAAPLTCAGVTTYKAIKVAGTRPSDLVAVFGVGGLGHMAIQYAGIAGGRVIAVDLVDEKLELARKLGAEFTVNAAREDPAAAIQELGGADQAIALAVSSASFEQAYRSLRRGGTLVFVALPAENQMTLPIFETVLNGITVVGSIVGTRGDLRDVFELHAAGRTEVIREVRPLAEVNESIADVEAGRVAARIVFRP
jgi:propanol-preferring alcohol dehydrogenase